MPIIKTSLQIALTIALLTSCQNPNSDQTCGTWLSERPEISTDPSTFQQSARACVERWSARLARGSDNLRVIADAVVAACHQEIERLEDGEIVSYDRTKPLNSQVREYWHGRSMFIGAQVRAANCYPDA